AQQSAPPMARGAAKTVWTANASVPGAPRAQFDLQAVRSDLTGKSPYCPVTMRELPGTPGAEEASPATQTTVGESQVQTANGDASDSAQTLPVSLKGD